MAEYIERKDLEFPYMTMTLWGLNHETCHAYNEGVKAAADYIASLPAADVVPVVHGKWVDNIDENGFLCNAWRSCSACGCLNFSKKPPYCPNCGARMDGE